MKAEKQSRINSMNFDEMDALRGKLGNQEVRLWYKTKIKKIENELNKPPQLEERARTAFELRQKIRANARALMADEKSKAALPDREITFEELIKRKMRKKGLSRKEALEDIIRSSMGSNPEYDKKAGIK